MQQHFDTALRGFVQEGSGWKCFPAKGLGSRDLDSDDYPFTTMLRMNTRHVGIPYYNKNHTILGVDVVSAYSLQFFGDGQENAAMDKSIATGLWLIGEEAERHLTPFQFSILQYTEARELSSVVNGRFEDRAVVSMRVRHQVTIDQDVGEPIAVAEVVVENKDEFIR